MKITFIGVGDATDSKPNTSVLIEGDTSMLFDCGYSVPPALWRYSSDQNMLDSIIISHLHADHFFGLAPLLIRMIEGQRTKPITIICPKGYEDLLKQSLDLGYGDIFEKKQFEVNYQLIEEGDSLKVAEYTLTFAKTTHARGNHAVRIDDGEQIVCLSGDGRMTESSRKLFEGCDLLIHDAFHEVDMPAGEPMGHESIEALIKYHQMTPSIKRIAFVHVWKNYGQEMRAKYQNESHFFAKEGETIELK